MMNKFEPKAIILTIGFRPNMGGLETHLTDLTNELRKRFPLLVVTLSPLTTKVEAERVEFEDNLLIWRIPWLGRGIFYKLLKYPLLEFFYLTPPIFFGLLWALIKYPSIEVVHAQGLSGVFTGGILGKLFRKKVVVSTHFVYHFGNDFKSKIYKMIFNMADRILCVSNASGEEMFEAGIAKKKIGKCAYWIDLDIFKPTEKMEAKKKVRWSDNFSVFFIGRLVEEKGILPLLEAIKLVPKEIQFYFAGNGPLQSEVENMAEKYKNIHFLGKIDNTLTPLYFSAADLVVVPSYEETLGRVNMEALACSTPVVGSNTGGIKEVVSEDVGILFDVEPKAMADAIIRLFEDKNLYSKFKKNARKRIEELYSKKNAEVFVKEYGFN